MWNTPLEELLYWWTGALSDNTRGCVDRLRERFFAPPVDNYEELGRYEVNALMSAYVRRMLYRKLQSVKPAATADYQLKAVTVVCGELEYLVFHGGSITCDKLIHEDEFPELYGEHHAPLYASFGKLLQYVHHYSGVHLKFPDGVEVNSPIFRKEPVKDIMDYFDLCE